MKKTVLLPALVGCLLILSGCMGSKSETEDTTTQEITVGPERVHCVGVGPMDCLVVDGDFFYDEIEGFTHEEGYTYTLRVKRTQICDPEVFNDCPQDASIYHYTLIDEISKEPVSQ